MDLPPAEGVFCCQRLPLAEVTISAALSGILLRLCLHVIVLRKAWPVLQSLLQCL